MIKPLILRTLLANVGITALGIVNSILLSRWLGPSGRGEVAAAMLWPAMLISLSSLGLISSSLYFSALPKSRLQPLFSTAVVLSVAQGLFAISIGFVILPLLLPSQAKSVVSASRVYLFVVPLALVTQCGMSILQGRMRIAMVNW